MKRFMSITLGLALTVLLTGCSQDTAVSLDQDARDGTGVLGKIEDAPPASGPNIIRFENDLFLVHRDGDLLTILGIDADDFCLSGGVFDPVSIMNINSPEDPNRIIRLEQADNVVGQVYDLPFPANCGDILGADPIWEGVADYVNTDNDLQVFLNPDNVNRNAFGFTYHGIGVNGLSKCVWDGNDLATLRCVDNINVR